MIHRAKFSLVAMLGAATLLIGISSVAAPPALAKGTKPKVLLQDPLSKADKAVRPSVDPAGQGQVTWSFVNHQFQGQDISPDDAHTYAPKFKNQGTIALANITTEVQVALLPNPQSSGAVLCRANGLSGAAQAFYSLVTFASGDYRVEKYIAGTYQHLATGTFQPQKSNHLTLTCAGPGQPGPTDTVTFTGSVNGQTFTAQDSSSPYPGGNMEFQVGGATAQAPGGASFSNLKVTQNS
ncbi:MAG TPA: hypothetical protein VLV81_03400 [Acidimicrobiia bacterium]|nr:hypothetical protein [Acidimicrobiia bacterium]